MLAMDTVQRFGVAITENRKDFLSCRWGIGCRSVLCFAFGKNVSVAGSNVYRVIASFLEIEAKR
jgi:adenine-specific DNA glycosylase